MKAAAVVGIDVGGPRKGYHAVALVDGRYAAQCHACDPAEIVGWCLDLGARHVGVDAPCRWSRDGRRRPAEAALQAAGIACFASPTRDAAVAHEAAAQQRQRAGWYGWMFEGERLYRSLLAHYALYTGVRDVPRCCFETFPQAVACALAGRIVSARQKRRVRRELLTRAGVDIRALTNIDKVDAALCALAAQRFAEGRFSGYGDADDGFVIVPDAALPADQIAR